MLSPSLFHSACRKVESVLFCQNKSFYFLTTVFFSFRKSVKNHESATEYNLEILQIEYKAIVSKSVVDGTSFEANIDNTAKSYLVSVADRDKYLLFGTEKGQKRAPLLSVDRSLQYHALCFVARLYASTLLIENHCYYFAFM